MAAMHGLCKHDYGWLQMPLSMFLEHTNCRAGLTPSKTAGTKRLLHPSTALMTKGGAHMAKGSQPGPPLLSPPESPSSE